MIAPLRRTHRRTFAILAIILPVVLIGGVAARHADFRTSEAPLAGTKLPSVGVKFTISALDGRRSTIRPRSPVPDPLVYWSAQPPHADRLPADARFLAPLDGRTFELPGSGFVILYSGGHSRVVDHARVEVHP